jgi:hypothetical protein
MEFLDAINLRGLLFAVIILVPHIIFAKTHRYDLRDIGNRAMLYIERIGKYGSILLMAVNIGVLEEGFTSPLMEQFWFVFTAVMSGVYILLWMIFFKKTNKLISTLITIVFSVIVIISGLLQVKTLLLTAGVVYLIGEIYVNKELKI